MRNLKCDFLVFPKFVAFERVKACARRYSAVTFLPIPLCYVSKLFHTTLMLLAFLSCIWNGAVGGCTR